MHLQTATALLEQARAEIALHEREGHDYPADIDARALETAVIDMAVAYAALGETSKASEVISDLEPIEGTEAERLQNEETLSMLRRSR
jgi:hypothetical protein